MKVSELCLGTWRFGRETVGTVETSRERAYEILDAAWERGINLIDTSNTYGDAAGTAERWIGDWLSDHDREDFVIMSKVYHDPGAGYPHVVGSRKRISEGNSRPRWIDSERTISMSTTFIDRTNGRRSTIRSECLIPSSARD